MHSTKKLFDKISYPSVDDIIEAIIRDLPKTITSKWEEKHFASFYKVARLVGPEFILAGVKTTTHSLGKENCPTIMEEYLIGIAKERAKHGRNRYFDY